MRYETIVESKGIYQRYSGRISKQDRINASSDFMENPLFDTFNYWIIDSLAIDEYLLDQDDALQAAASDIGAAFTSKFILIAFVATNKDHRDNILHFMELLKQSEITWKIELFDNLESASAWIVINTHSA